jgi:hypothetical protein
MSADPGVMGSLTGDASTTGAVSIGDMTRTLPEAEARTLFLAAAAMAARRPGALAIDKDTCVVITAATRIVLTIDDGFAEVYDPDESLVAALAPAQGRRTARET